MKKLSVALLIASLILKNDVMAQVNPHIQGILNASPFGTPAFLNQGTKAQKLDIETPYRCQANGFGVGQISTTLPVDLNDFRLIKTTKSDPLPRFEVNGYTFSSTPIDEAIQTLVEEADITVYTQDKTYPSLSAKDLYGDLESVIRALLSNVEMYYSYTEAGQKLYIARQADFVISLPKNRLVMLGVLDALRGAGIENIVVDWNQSLLRLKLTYKEEKTVKKLIDSIKQNGEMLVADTSVYRLNAYQNWNRIMASYGLDRVHSSNSGLNGKLLVLGHQKGQNSLLNVLGRQSGAHLLSKGLAVVPNGWRMFLDTGKCATTGYGLPLVISLNPLMKSNAHIVTDLSLSTPQGELSSFSVNASLDDELAVIGLQDGQMGGELLILVKLKLIRLVGEK